MFVFLLGYENLVVLAPVFVASLFAHAVVAGREVLSAADVIGGLEAVIGVLPLSGGALCALPA